VSYRGSDITGCGDQMGRGEEKTGGGRQRRIGSGRGLEVGTWDSLYRTK